MFWFIVKEKAPDQNRTDTSSLEGYGSTIELQALKFTTNVVTELRYFSKKFPSFEELLKKYFSLYGQNITM